MIDQESSKKQTPLIRMNAVSKAFGSLVVLDQLDLSIERGATTVIIGPSGTGKSVMLKLMTALLRPDSGEVRFEDQRIDHLSETRLTKVRTQFGFLFQMGALFDSMNVMQNVAFPLIEHTTMSQGDREQRVREVLERVGLDGTQEKLPAQLSGGQRKRIALARAIALQPKIILYDEPTTGLDPIRADVINDLIVRLKDELQMTSVVVTHDMASVYKIADRVMMLYEGKFVADGTPDEIRQSDDPMVQSFVEGRVNEYTRQAGLTQ